MRYNVYNTPMPIAIPMPLGACLGHGIAYAIASIVPKLYGINIAGVRHRLDVGKVWVMMGGRDVLLGQKRLRCQPTHKL